MLDITDERIEITNTRQLKRNAQNQLKMELLIVTLTSSGAETLNPKLLSGEYQLLHQFPMYSLHFEKDDHSHGENDHTIATTSLPIIPSCYCRKPQCGWILQKRAIIPKSKIQLQTKNLRNNPPSP